MRVALLGVAFIVFAGLVGYVLNGNARAERDEARIAELERRVTQTRGEMATADQFHELRQRVWERFDSFEQRVSVSSQTAVVATPRAQEAPVRAAPRPFANWWCYFGRECFRSKDDCAHGDDNRTSECKPSRRAWCGGVDGKQCFAGQGDCTSLEFPMPKFEDMTLPTRGRPCVEVE